MTTNPGPDTVVKLSSPADIIATVPVTVGFHPTDSLVVMCLHGPRKRTGLTMRVDLPEPRFHQEVASDIATRARCQEADTVIAVCYTDEADSSAEFPRRELVDLLLDELADRGIGWTEVLLVRDGRWYSYSCGFECCPREGTPITPPDSAEILALEARSALVGKAVLGSRAELEATVRGPAAIRELALNATYAIQGEILFTEVEVGGANAALRRTLDLARAGFERFRSGHHEVADGEAVRVVLGLGDHVARDALLTWGLDHDPHELVVYLSALARCAVAGHAAPVCTVLACIAYQMGNGALANVALERALGDEPDYRLAELVDAALRAQVPPDEMRKMAERTRDHLRAQGIDVAGGGRRAA